MPTLKNFTPQDLGVLLAGDRIDASSGALFPATNKVDAETRFRTILIGLGGTGVKTINYVKAELTKRFSAGWEKYIAFLGVDADENEFAAANCLKQVNNEVAYLNRPNVDERIQNPAAWPVAIRPFMPDGGIKNVVLKGDGCAQKRLIGKIKVHDKDSANPAVDISIITKLKKLVSEQLDAGGAYKVYVIGSLCGGTGAGTFTEMPALIRRAFSPIKPEIYGMFYTPDTMEALDTTKANVFKANGYACLKELNYYMGVSMRQDDGNPSVEKFYLNDPAHPEETISGIGDYYLIPYLIGEPGLPSVTSSSNARITIAEFFVNILGKIVDGTTNGGVHMLDSFLSNALGHIGFRDTDGGLLDKEAAGSAHEFPKRFGSIGFAKAAIPQKLVRTYSVALICKDAGIRSVDQDTIARVKADLNHTGLIPWRDEKNYKTAREGTQEAEAILAPLAALPGQINSDDFSLAALNICELTFDNIQKGEVEAASKRPVDQNVAARKLQAQERIKEFISKAFDAVGTNIKNYIKKEGPHAFYNIYNGKFIPDGDYHGLGIRAMLDNLGEGKLLNGMAVSWLNSAEAQDKLNVCKRNIEIQKAGILRHVFHGSIDQLAASWVGAFNALQSARIVESTKHFFLSNMGYYHQEVYMPLAILADNIHWFGLTIDFLCDTYTEKGRKMESFSEFQNSSDNTSEVNLAGVDQSAYSWLKEQAENACDQVNKQEFRNGLVDSFFEHPSEWLDVPDQCVVKEEGKSVKLQNPDMAIPARGYFDRFLSSQITSELDVSIERVFVQLQKNGVSYDMTAQNIMTKLKDIGGIRLHADISSTCMNNYVLYPESLSRIPEGANIIAAIIAAASAVLNNCVAYACGDTESISLHRQAVPFELYNITKVKEWEEYYEHMLGVSDSLMHGKSPSLEITSDPVNGTIYTELFPWKDYPRITIGEPSDNEKKVLDALDRDIRQARELGVLFSERVDDGVSPRYRIRMINGDKLDHLVFDLIACMPNEEGLLPLGKDLSESLAAQNGEKLETLTEIVHLEESELLSVPRFSEDWAWTYVQKILRVHIPMYLRMKKALAKYQKWAEDIKTYNEDVLRQRKPAQFTKMLQSGVVTLTAANQWVVRFSDKPAKVFVNMNMIKHIPPKERNMLQEGLLYFYVYRKLITSLGSDKEFEACRCFAETEYTRLLNEGDSEAMDVLYEKVEDMKAEYTKLVELGMNCENPDVVMHKFQKEMQMLESDSDVLAEIQKFYTRAVSEID